MIPFGKASLHDILKKPKIACYYIQFCKVNTTLCAWYMK